MRSTLAKIPKQHGPVVPEAGWKSAGSTPIGQQLYTQSIPMSRAVPLYEELTCTECDGDRELRAGCEECDGTGKVDGERIWVTNPLNGDRLYPKNKPEFYDQERLFFVESDGAFNQYLVDWAPPTQEEVQAAIHAKQVADMIPNLASALVDKGLDVNEIVKRLTEPVAEVEDLAPEPVDAPTEEPGDIAPAVDEGTNEEL